jgi:hypothetical protein
MPESMRFTKKEQALLHAGCIKLNKQLVAMGQIPIRESELAHLLIEKGIKNVTVTKTGAIEMDI